MVYGLAPLVKYPVLIPPNTWIKWLINSFTNHSSLWVMTRMFVAQEVWQVHSRNSIKNVKQNKNIQTGVWLLVGVSISTIQKLSYKRLRNETLFLKLHHAIVMVHVKIRWFSPARVDEMLRIEHMHTFSSLCNKYVLNCRTPRPLEFGSIVWAFSNAVKRPVSTEQRKISETTFR
jgi:hypothetical protein